MARGDDNQVVYVDGDVPQLPIQLGQLLVDSSGIAPGTTNLQQCTSQSPLAYEPVQGGYPRTDVEIAEGITPVNYAYPPGNVLRYGNNTNPGVTDMIDAIRSAILCAGVGDFRGVVEIPAGLYLVTESINTVLPPVSNTRPIWIRGDGDATQILNGASAGKPTFNMSAVDGWRVSSLLLLGRAANPNDGFRVNTAGAGGIRWLIEDVTSVVFGRGLVCEDSNTGVIRNFAHWPDTIDAAIIGGMPTANTDVDHGIYLTGSFIHDISIYDADCFARDSFKPGACGIRCDASGQNHGIRIFGGMFQGNAGNNRNGISLDNCNAFNIVGAYHESSVLRIDTGTAGIIQGTNNGAVEGEILLTGTSINNTLIGCNADSLEFANPACVANTVIGCAIETVTDAAAPSNRYLGMRATSTLAFYGNDRGGDPWIPVTYSASMTPDVASGKQFNIVPSNNSAFTINEPANPLAGETVTIKIRNATGGALGALTWGAQYRAASTTQPANGFSIIRKFTYDTSYGSGVLWIQTGADVTVAN